MATRRKFTAKFKKKVVLEALSERYTMSDLAQRHSLHPQQITMWKKHFLANADRVFEDTSVRNDKDTEAERDALLRTIGQLKVENDFLKKKLL
jgi:transposase